MKHIGTAYPQLAELVGTLSPDTEAVDDVEVLGSQTIPPLDQKIGFTGLREFLFHYAPVAALLDRGSRRKLGLGRKTLESFSFLSHVKKNFI